MLYDVRLKPSAEHELRALPVPDQRRLGQAIQRLADNPFRGKKLKGEYEGYYSMRVWPYRVIYSAYKGKLLVLVIRIGHRQGVY